MGSEHTSVTWKKRFKHFSHEHNTYYCDNWRSVNSYEWSSIMIHRLLNANLQQCIAAVYSWAIKRWGSFLQYNCLSCDSLTEGLRRCGPGSTHWTQCSGEAHKSDLRPADGVESPPLLTIWGQWKENQFEPFIGSIHFFQTDLQRPRRIPASEFFMKKLL